MSGNRRGLLLGSPFGKCDRAFRSTQNRYEAHDGALSVAQPDETARKRPRRERSDPSYVRQ